MRENVSQDTCYFSIDKTFGVRMGEGGWGEGAGGRGLGEGGWGKGSWGEGAGEGGKHEKTQSSLKLNAYFVSRNCSRGVRSKAFACLLVCASSLPSVVSFFLLSGAFL